ncbi:MAG: NTP transferase domain-containing protein, partial [Planctomycetota bacterium]
MHERLAGMVLAAGHGTRMRSNMPKLLHNLLGKKLLEYPLRLLEELGCARQVVVAGAGADQVQEAFHSWEGSPIEWAFQDPPLGTGDAVRVGLEALGSWDGPLVILNGDLPLLSGETVRSLVATHHQEQADFTLLSLERSNPQGYGRLLRDAQGEILAVVEEADATPEERAICEINGGVYVADAEALSAGLKECMKAGAGNAQGEIYLPPVLGPIRNAGGKISAWQLASDRQDELQQVNSRSDLASASSIRRRQICDALLENGVTIVDPALTYIEEDVEIGQDTVILPF